MRYGKLHANIFRLRTKISVIIDVSRIKTKYVIRAINFLCYTGITHFVTLNVFISSPIFFNLFLALLILAKLISFFTFFKFLIIALSLIWSILFKVFSNQFSTLGNFASKFVNFLLIFFFSLLLFKSAFLMVETTKIYG